MAQNWAWPPHLALDWPPSKFKALLLLLYFTGSKAISLQLCKEKSTPKMSQLVASNCTAYSHSENVEIDDWLTHLWRHYWSSQRLLYCTVDVLSSLLSTHPVEAQQTLDSRRVGHWSVIVLLRRRSPDSSNDVPSSSFTPLFFWITLNQKYYMPASDFSYFHPAYTQPILRPALCSSAVLLTARLRLIQLLGAAVQLRINSANSIAFSSA